MPGHRPPEGRAPVAPGSAERRLLGLPLVDALVVALVSMAIAVTIGAFAASALGETPATPRPTPLHPTPVASQALAPSPSPPPITLGGSFP